MTIGERIAQIRKERGLSQEAFGDSLGVSRQSISKWEANQSIPDVEKLISISRLYGISVGWILGTEEERQSGGELDEVQLRMVELIAEKYIQAIPKPVVKRKKKWPIVLAVCAFAVVLIWGINTSHKLSSIQDRQANLEYSVYNIQSDLSSEVNGMSYRLEEFLKAQNSLLVEYSAEYGEKDLQNGCLPVRASAVPKTYVPGLKLEFVFDDGISVQCVPGIEDENHMFSAETVCNLTDSLEVSVVLCDGETEQTQLLEYWDYLLTNSYVPVYNYYTDFWCDTPEELIRDGKELGVFFVPWENYPELLAETVEFRIFVNGELVEDLMAEEGFDPEDFVGFPEDVYGFTVQMPTEFLETIKEGDLLEIATVVTDSYGRRYVLNVDAFNLGEDGMFDFFVYDDDHWAKYSSDPKWIV